MTFVHRMFDYIIVGGGTSGLLLLNRLTEDPSINVLVLEAGEDRAKDPRINTPAFWTSLVGTEIDWAFQTKPQVYFLSLYRVPLIRFKRLVCMIGLRKFLKAKFLVDPAH